MEIRKTYRFEYEKDGKLMSGMSAGFLPDYATRVIQEYELLYPAKGMELVEKETCKKYSSVLVGDGFDINNYEEAVREEIKPKLEFDKHE